MTPKSHFRIHARLTWFALLLLISMVEEVAVAADRIIQPVDNATVTRLKGNVHPLARKGTDLGKLSGSAQLERMKLVFTPTAAQESALDTLLQQQQEPGSPNYHKWLTPEQFGARFGLSQADFSKVSLWLQSQGFRVVDAPPSRNYIAFSGTAAQVGAAFHTSIHSYSVNDRAHYANATEPSIPAALAGVVGGIASLNNFAPKPKMVRPRPRVTSSYSGNHFMAPGDFATIYNLTGLYKSGIDGTGQTIAVAGQTDLVTDTNGNFSDVVTFRKNSGLSAPNIKTVLVSTDPGVVKDDIDEASLDVEWAGGIAKNAAIIYVIGNATSGGGSFDALQYAVTHAVAPVISISYGLCEAQLDNATQTNLTNAGKQANAQGQTIVAPSGDSGAADCDYSTGTNTVTTATHGYAVDFPASMPYATAMGGSEFTGTPPGSDVPGTVTHNADGTTTAAATQYWSGSTSLSDTSATALSYIAETVWNDTATNGVLAAGGGGLSILFTQPSWQTGLAAITNGMRGIPDLSFSSSADHDGYLICSQGSCSCGFRNSCTIVNNTTQGTFDSTGGTSAAVPTFAAIVALINQKTGGKQGNVNPSLYKLAGTNAGVFHDITTGNNIVPCTQKTKDCPATAPFQIGYSAGTGYDLASGLGSVDVGALVADWGGAAAGDFQIATSPSTLALSSGSTGTDTITISSIGGFSGAVALTCSVSSSLGATTCALSPTSVNTSGTATLTINAATLTAAFDHRLSPGVWGMGGSFLIAAVLLVPAGRPNCGPRARRSWLTIFATLIALTVILSITSCGGGGSGQGQNTRTPLSGTVTVTGTSGGLTHTAQIAVTVN